MQYLLTEKEYDDLLDHKKLALTLETEKLQELCIKIAEDMPITRHWDKENYFPWGCILSKKDNSGYCDECPVQDICPHPSKEWSK